MKSSTMDVITKEWLQDKAFVDDIAFLCTKDVILHPYLFDFYLTELVKLKDAKKISLTAQGLLDTYHIEFSQRAEFKKARKELKSPLPLSFC